MTDNERQTAEKGLEMAERRLAEQRENLSRIDRQMEDGAALRASVAAQVADAELLVRLLNERFGVDSGE